MLEDKQFERLGSSKATKIDTRIIAATHRDLEKRIEADMFREDLYYRLNVFPIRVPPLRERTEDIPMLVWRFVEDFSAAFGKRVESITKDNMEMLQRYSWPGNVRELRNLVERAVIGANGPRLTIALPQSSAATARRSVRLADVEKEHIKSVLDSTRWRIRGVGGAADQLGLKPRHSRRAWRNWGSSARTADSDIPGSLRDLGDTRAPVEVTGSSSIGGNWKQHRSIAILFLPALRLVRLLLQSGAWCA